MIVLLLMVLILAGAAIYVAFPLLPGEGAAAGSSGPASPPGLTGIVRDRSRRE